MKTRNLALASLLGVLTFSSGTKAEDLADVYERLFEITPFAGTFLPDENIRYPDGSGMLGIRASLNNSSYWGLEGTLALAPGQTHLSTRGMLNQYSVQPVFDPQGRPTAGVVISDIDLDETIVENDSNLLFLGAAAVVHLSKKSFRPFISVGGGLIDDISNSDENPQSPFSNLYLDLGIGVKLYRKSGFALRLDIRDYVMRRQNLPRESERAPLLAALRDLAPAPGDSSGTPSGGADGILGQEPYDPFEYRGKRWLNNFSITLSASFPLGFAWKDTDGDQIADRFDNCLTTAPGVVVDGAGCGVDTDRDGVFNGLDQCAATPFGATVDIAGCPSDRDNDKVFDGIDVADDTPEGALVDERGQHFDTDSDGIWDGLDLCNETPIGAQITAEGCVANQLEGMLLRGEVIVVNNVNFDAEGDELEPLSFHYVNRVARLLEHWTGNEEQPLKIEVGVHTDGIGSDDYNLALSQRRAESVRLYMLENFFRMGANNLVATGYGESNPLADDSSLEGRVQNRRLEIRSLGTGDAPKAFGADQIIETVDDFGVPEIELPDDLELPDGLELPDEIERPDFDIDDEE